MNKVAVITGISYGLGESLTLNLLDQDFKVYGISRTQPKIENERLSWIQADLLKDKDIKSIVEQIKEEKIDVLVNSAGIAFFQKTSDYTDKDFDRMFDLNFKAQVKITNALLPKLMNGLILTISSLGDRYPDIEWGLYATSKAALNIYFETMAVENDQVKFVNVLPSYVDTPMQHALHDGTDFDWSMCMKQEDVAQAMANIIQNNTQIKSGSRVIIEQSFNKDEQYLPEKLWIYPINTKKLYQIR